MDKNQQAQPDENPNGFAMAIEPPVYTIARLNARVEMVAQERDSIQVLANDRAMRIETLEAALHMERQELRRYVFAIDGGREALHVFTGDPEGFIRYLVGRQTCAWDTVAKLTAFIDAKLFKAGDGNPPVGRIDREEIARRVEVISLTLQTLAGTITGEPVGMPALPHEAALLDDWLASMRESVKITEENKRPQEVYYCPTCKRHVAPEDVKGIRMTEGMAEYYHAQEHGGCGKEVIVGIRDLRPESTVDLR